MTKPHHLSNQPQAFKSHKYMRAPISFYLPRQVICIAPVTLNPQTQHSHPFPQADAPASKTVLPVPRAYNFFLIILPTHQVSPNLKPYLFAQNASRKPLPSIQSKTAYPPGAPAAHRLKSAKWIPPVLGGRMSAPAPPWHSSIIAPL